MKYLNTLILLTATASSAFALDGTYSANANLTNWNDATKWVGGVAADGAGYTATIDRTNFSAARTVTQSNGMTIGSIAFTGIASAARNAIISGNGTITLDNSGSASWVTNDGWGSGTINNAVILENDLNLRNSPGNTTTSTDMSAYLTLGGHVSNGAADPVTITTYKSPTNPTNPQNHRIVFSGGISGNIDIRHNSGNNLNIQAVANTFVGNLYIRSGNVNVSTGLGSSALGNAANKIVFEVRDNVINDALGVLSFSGAIAAGSANAVITQAIELQGDGYVSVADTSGTMTASGLISGAGNFNVSGTGRLVLDANNTYTGKTIISATELAIARDNAINSASGLTLLSGGIFNADGFSQSFALLSLQGDATLNLGNGGTIVFGDSSAEDWDTYVLSIIGDFTDGTSVRFGTDETGLTADQIAKITINGAAAAGLNANGYLYAIPEPSLAAMLLGGIALIFVARRRR